MEFAPATGSNSQQTIHLKIPDGIDCDHCVLHWSYVTANSADTYPEARRRTVRLATLPLWLPSDLRPTPS